MKDKKQIVPKEESWIFPSTKEYKLPNGELIGGYFTMQGNIGDIFKYKNEELIDKLKYKGPIPYFSIPIGQDLMGKMNANGGKYSGMNKNEYFIIFKSFLNFIMRYKFNKSKSSMRSPLILKVILKF